MLLRSLASVRAAKLSPAASSHLNLVRSVAALAVASEHVRNLFWVDYARIQHPQAVLGLFYLLTGVGHQAVMVFFVLSGFFISGTVFRLRPETWSPRSYAIDRLSRLYIVLVPALLLGALCDFLTMRLPGSHTYFFRPIEHFGQAFQSGFSSKSFLGNLFFLQGSFVRPFGSNGPLWSLANEFWYYVAWALLCLALFALNPRRRLLAALLLLLAYVTISRSIWLAFPIWLMGACVHALPRSSLLSKRAFNIIAMFVATSIFALTLFLSKKGNLGPGGDYWIGAAFTLLLYAIVHSQSRTAGRYSQLSKFFADFSFSLYVVHFPILILLRTLMSGIQPLQPGIIAAAILAALLLALLAAGYIFSLATESHTGKLRSKLQSLFPAKPPLVAIPDFPSSTSPAPVTSYAE